MDFLVAIGESFIKLINTGGETLVGMITGILPAALIALTIMNTIIALVGQDRIEGLAQRLAGKRILVRYLFLPYLSAFFFSNPTAFLMGRFLPERYKPGYYEAVNCSTMAPLMCFFPHVNPAELYAWLGVADGVMKLGLPIGPLAVSVFFLAMFTTTLKAFVVEKIAHALARKKGLDWDKLEARKLGQPMEEPLL